MHPNAELIQRFYTAFQKKDGAALASFYHPEAQFSDPVFQDAVTRATQAPSAATMTSSKTARTMLLCDIRPLSVVHEPTERRTAVFGEPPPYGVGPVVPSVPER